MQDGLSDRARDMLNLIKASLMEAVSSQGATV